MAQVFTHVAHAERGSSRDVARGWNVVVYPVDADGEVAGEPVILVSGINQKSALRTVTELYRILAAERGAAYRPLVE